MDAKPGQGLRQARCQSSTELSETRLAGNFATLRAAAGAGTEVLAVIKADAYGHGAARVARTLARAGTRWFGVSCASEGAAVREALIAAGHGPDDADACDILMLSGVLADDLADVLAHRLTAVIWTAEQAELLAGGAASAQAGLAPLRPVHVEIDTGMGREGLQPGAELAGLLDRMGPLGLPLGGLMTHFASSECAGDPLLARQQGRFEQAVAQVRELGLRPAWLHAGNSATLENTARPTTWLAQLAAAAGARALVRTGLGLYGYSLVHRQEGASQEPLPAALQPVLTWRAPVLAVRTLAAGDTVGYNATFVAPGPMRVALLPVGYADGLRRELSSSNLPGGERDGGWAMLHGQRAPILGRVSMNLTVIDVSSIPGVAAGDEATLLGDGVTAEDHARLACTIPYEILCGLGGVSRRTPV